ncbi:hypothetical protein [Sciscionella marina]|uniref:hypothetical protein n=1 Tax=Sciscionella marina TaxID=508770 RepID=UPI0003766559|nr:hypothetical protein [Sciscionella marina]
MKGNGWIRYTTGEDGARLAYRKPGEGRPLVLVHGFCGFADRHRIRAGTGTVHGRTSGHLYPDVLATDGPFCALGARVVARFFAEVSPAW